ncbi:LysR family transcriptional regulator [Ferrimonas sp. SCSIO 43195]|uniref:LysR family transcriptional regulator n=1 Tax=Ferrimonas sp. SCSIO 43195 TaxID=2822844 RepID=UPI00207610E7|nr:LysR family transcriptional regulator [Ferrimonas sp. SCSIO 43195]USD39276.1 LysR family transcriptional regulator [Ferrimonas sp. SCSIO 43195]
MRHNLNQLRVLSALLQQPNLTRVAERLHMTQSAVSKTLHQLRQDFDDPLLVREGQRYLLTPKAQSLQLTLPQQLQQLDALYLPQSFDPSLCQRTLVFSSSDYVAQHIFPAIAAEVARQAPLVTLEYRLWDKGQLSQLASLPVDLVSTIVESVPDNVARRDQGEDGLAVLMSADHPLAEQTLTLERYLQFEHLRVSGGGDKDSPVDTALQALGHRRRCFAQVPFFQSALGLLMSTPTLLTTPLHIAAQMSEQAPMVVKRLPFDCARQHYRLLWHRRFNEDPAHRWFRELAFPFLCDHLNHYVQKGITKTTCRHE